MKYKGTVFGFESEYGSIYSIPDIDKRCYAWRSDVTAEFNDNMFSIKFIWDGESFEFILKRVKPGYFSGKALYNKEEGGKVFFWAFQGEIALLLKGVFEEEEAGNYDCFIELREV